MPQLILSSHPQYKSLSLETRKCSMQVKTESKAHKGDQPNLLAMHHQEEDKAVARGSNRKRHSPEGGGVASSKSKKHKNAYEIKGKIATAEDAARMDKNPPLNVITRLLESQDKEDKKIEAGDSVVYWMRMEDMRVEDNTALYKASEAAEKFNIPLVVLFVISPNDYDWHDRSARRIDFMLRNARIVQIKLHELNIPLVIKQYEKRHSIPRKIVTEVLPSLGAKHLFGNMEYEVDELNRDIKTIIHAKENGIKAQFFHDRLAVPPGKIFSKIGKPISVYSPWQRRWAQIIEKEPHLLDMSPLPKANSNALREGHILAHLFDEKVPNSVPGFECEDRETMVKLWPEGTDAAKQVLSNFFYAKARKDGFRIVSPLASDTESSKASDGKSRVTNYSTGRNLVNGDHSSKLSPYLASGVISVRYVLNEAKKLGRKGNLETSRDTGIGNWVQEVAWRDFYNQVMATWPRVSMGRPFLEKFADVQWETSEENLQAWKDGKTGYPIVDAAMRACKARGWMENRVRMVAACFLVKDLMLDWRLGERHFMQSFIDGDLAANNGGWQWTASTGTDPQPYFRIFNSKTQSEKCDPNGDYIRHWVPELRNLKGKAVHDPYHILPSNEFKKLGYPAPIVEHKEARERALYRYKNVGEISNEEHKDGVA
ncbi:hypothetical protein L204_105049 [Cryptococcus depauperatus]